MASTLVSSAECAIWSSSSPMTFSASSVSPWIPIFFMAWLDSWSDFKSSLSSSLLCRASSCLSTTDKQDWVRWTFSEIRRLSMTKRLAATLSPTRFRDKASRPRDSSWAANSRSLARRVALHDSRCTHASSMSLPSTAGSTRPRT